MKPGHQSKRRQHGAGRQLFLLLIFAAAPALFIGRSGTARAFSNSSLSGTYACKLDGSFIRQPFSTAIVTFTADGKGTIDGLGNVSTSIQVKSGGMDVVMSAFGTGQTPSPGAPAVYFGEFLNEACQFLVHDGTYGVGPEGRGTMTMNWTARKVNSTSPIDCSKDLNPTTYELLLTSTSAFHLLETDASTTSCTSGGVNYTNCGAIMSGTCTKQTGVTFPHTVPTP